MLGALLLAMTAATPVKVAAMGLKPVKADPTEATFFTDYLVQQLRQGGGVEVVTQSELTEILGLERQKQLLGCADSGSGNCLAELSGALGVDGIVSGNVAKLGDSYALTLALVRVSDGRAVASLSEKLKTADDVLDWLKRSAPGLRDAALSLKGTPAPPPASGSPRVLPLVLLGAGAVGTVVGVALQVIARNTASAVANRQSGITAANVDSVIQGGKTNEAASIVAMSLGLVALAGGLLWLLLGSSR